MSRPLEGVRVVVTRAAHQADDLAAAFEAAGARVERLPLLAVVPPADEAPLARAAARIRCYAWVVFTSTNTVDTFLPHLGQPHAGRWPAATRAAAVGPATATALRAAGVEPALVADDARGEGLAAALAPLLQPPGRLLLPQADDARPETAAALRALGVEVDAVVAYTKRRPPGVVERLRTLAAEPGIWLTVTSPRIARDLAELLGEAWEKTAATARFVAIGPTTAAELRRLGADPTVAEEPSASALVAAVVAGKAR